MFNSIFLDITLGILSIVILTGLIRRRKHEATLPLPPGPRPLPFISNLLDLPKGLEAPHWAKHRELYGPISSLSVFGTTIVILNDAEACFELLDKRSFIYSDRSVPQFGGKMAGFSGVTALIPYGDLFKTHRRELHKCIGTAAALQAFAELEEIETRRFLFRLLEEPSKLVEHIRKMTGAIILKISHGYTVSPYGRDPFVDLADATLENFSKSCKAGAWIVDILPLLRYLPEWLPGMGFKKTGREWHAITTEFIDKPFTFVRHQMKPGYTTPSLASSLIERNVSSEYNMKWIAAALYGGGADTTVSAVTTFFLAMVLFPAVLMEAQAEVDRVIGRDSLPALSDRVRLPYVEALAKEVLRWNNVAPMGVPHLLTEEDTYLGYRIPKGANVLSNIWQITHDPVIYHDPFAFRPERFLGDKPELDSRSLAYGFGRRICPGKELADSTLFISIAVTVAAFDITRARDASGRDVEVVNEYSSGIISHPKAFEYSIQPRDEQAASLIRTVMDDYPFESGDADILSSLPT